MAEFLTTNGTSYHIENIIIEAKTKLILVSPYLQISKTLFERLKDASNRNVKIKIIYGKDALKPNDKDTLAQLDNIRLFYFQNLHAKCYFNETRMVITSMNMYEFSEKNNREMGVLVDRATDKELFDKAVYETLSIIQSSQPAITGKANAGMNADRLQVIPPKLSQPCRVRGFCIRCAASIAHDANRPYCNQCYTIWAQFENTEYSENVCHSCGGQEQSTMSRPKCYRCYSESNKVEFRQYTQ